MANFSINNLITNEAEVKNLNNKPEDTEIQRAENIVPVRFKGGETVKDPEGKDITTQEVVVNNPNVSRGVAARAASLASRGPATAKEGEAESITELAQDRAQLLWEGKTVEKADKKLYDKNPLATTAYEKWLPKSTSEKAMTEKLDTPWLKAVESKDPSTGEKLYDYKDLDQETARLVQERYGLRVQGSNPGYTFKAIDFLNNKNLKDLKTNWNNILTAGVGGKTATYQTYEKMVKQLNDIRKNYSDEKGLKKLGIDSIEDLDLMLSYLKGSLGDVVNTRLGGDKQPETTPVAAPVEKVKPVEKPVATEETKPETTPVEEAPKTATEEAKPEEPDPIAVAYEQMQKEETEAEKEALRKAEEEAKKQKTREETEQQDKEILEAVRKAAQNELDYQEWLKHPNILSGIFGGILPKKFEEKWGIKNSGLSIAQRVGLGAATLFAIFSDAAANYAKGLNNVTDFKNAAMERLMYTVDKIRDKNAEALGDKAAQSIISETENNKKLDADVVKLDNDRSLYWINPETKRSMAQSMQLGKDPLDEMSVMELQKSFIDTVARNEHQKKLYLSEDGKSLNPEGEARFWGKFMPYALDAYKTVGNVSDEQINNAKKILDMKLTMAEYSKRISELDLSTTYDYDNVIRELTARNNELTLLKTKLSEAADIKTSLDLVQKAKDAITGLGADSRARAAEETNAEAVLEKDIAQRTESEINETLKKSGWKLGSKLELGADGKFKVPSLVKLDANAGIALEGERASEKLEKYVQDVAERATRELQSSKSKTLSNRNQLNSQQDKNFETIMKFYSSEELKGAKADFGKAREDAIRMIDEEINFNNDRIKYYEQLRSKAVERNETTQARENYISQFNDVPSKNADWYRSRLAIS